MKFGTALELLGISEWEATPERAREAFNSEVKRLHPDTGGEGADISKLIAARNLVLNRRNDAEFACKQCKGKGTVSARMGVKPCGACKGTGETRGS